MLPINRKLVNLDELGAKPKLPRNPDYERGLKDAIIWVVKNAEAYKPELLAVNMVDEGRQRGIRVDEEKLSERLGIPVVSTAVWGTRSLCGGTRRAMKGDNHNTVITKLTVGAMKKATIKFHGVVSIPHTQATATGIYNTRATFSKV